MTVSAMKCSRRLIPCWAEAALLKPLNPDTFNQISLV